MSKHDLDVCAHLVRIAHAFRGREDTRYYLKGVRIEPHPEAGVFIVATCGTNLIALHDRDGRTTRPATIRLRKLARKSFPKRGLYRLAMALPPVADGDLEALHPASIVRGTNEDRQQIVSVEPSAEIHGMYPDWRKLIGLLSAQMKSNPERALHSPIKGCNLKLFGRAAEELATLVYGVPFARNQALRLRGGARADDPTFVHFDENLRALGMVAALTVENATALPVLPAWAESAIDRATETEAAS